jgi:predicted amidohydrolase YtcJ
MITIDPAAGAVILIATSAAAGYALAKYPELPGILQRSVRQAKERLDAAREDGIPAELQALYDSAYAAVLAFESALEDDRITWRELREIGVHAVRLGRLVLSELGR